MQLEATLSYNISHICRQNRDLASFAHICLSDRKYPVTEITRTYLTQWDVYNLSLTYFTDTVWHQERRLRRLMRSWWHMCMASCFQEWMEFPMHHALMTPGVVLELHGQHQSSRYSQFGTTKHEPPIKTSPQ